MDGAGGSVAACAASGCAGAAVGATATGNGNVSASTGFDPMLAADEFDRPCRAISSVASLRFACATADEPGASASW